MKEQVKSGLKKTALVGSGIILLGSSAMAMTKDGKKFLKETLEKRSHRVEEVYEDTTENFFEVFNIEKEEKTEGNNTAKPEKTQKKDFFVVKDPKTGKVVATEKGVEGGDGEPKSGKHFTVDNNGNILTYVQEGTEEAKNSSFILDDDEMKAYTQLPSSDPEKQKAIAVFKLLNENNLNQSQKDEIISNFMRLLYNKSTKGFNVDNITAAKNNLKKHSYAGDFGKAIDNFFKAISNFFASKQKTETASNTTTPKKETAENDDDDFDPFASVADDDVEESEKALAEAKARVEKSLTQGREKILKAAKAYVATGGNPADIEGWDEISKELNITPDDL